VVQETLSNVVRHANASAVQVGVTARDGWLTVDVHDNGVGPDGIEERGGLVNLRERADGHEGSFAVTPGNPGGTAVTWSVPLRTPS
jgi:signal transduction histidine kinase